MSEDRENISEEQFNEWVNAFMNRPDRGPKLAIIGQATAKYIVELPGNMLHKIHRGNAAQRRRYRRAWHKQDDAILALSRLPEDSPERLMVRIDPQ